MLYRVIDVRDAALSTRSICWAPRVSLAPALAPRRHPRMAGKRPGLGAALETPVIRRRAISADAPVRAPLSPVPAFPPLFLSLPQPPWASQRQASGGLAVAIRSRARAHIASSASGARDRSTVRRGRRARRGRCELLTSCAASVRLLLLCQRGSGSPWACTHAVLQGFTPATAEALEDLLCTRLEAWLYQGCEDGHFNAYSTWLVTVSEGDAPHALASPGQCVCPSS